MKELGRHFFENEAEYPLRISGERESYLTVAEICEREAIPWTKVIRRIAPFKEQLDLPQEIRHLGGLLVPREVFIQIPFVTETNVPAGDWMTTTEMANSLNVDFKWVNRRILDLSSIGEYRICHLVNYPRFHLPPEALSELRKIRNRSLDQFDPGTYLNLDQIANALGRHRLWVGNRLDDILDELGAEPRLGLDDSGKSVEYYPKEVLEPLIKEKERYEDSGDRLTIPMLEREVGKNREWVEEQFEEMDAIGEYRRFEQSGRVDFCFSRITLTELLNRAGEYVNPEPGWFTERALREIIGKSDNWVRRRLKLLIAEPRIFQDSQGVSRKHYSPKVLSSLLRMKEVWVEFQAMEIEEYDGEDEIEQLRKALDYGQTMGKRTLLWLGIKESEIERWMRMGLITKWKSGMYYITKKTEIVIERATKAEKAARELEDLRFFLE